MRNVFENISFLRRSLDVVTRCWNGFFFVFWRVFYRFSVEYVRTFAQISIHDGEINVYNRLSFESHLNHRQIAKLYPYIWWNWIVDTKRCNTILLSHSHAITPRHPLIACSRNARHRYSASAVTRHSQPALNSTLHNCCESTIFFPFISISIFVI